MLRLRKSRAIHLMRLYVFKTWTGKSVVLSVFGLRNGNLKTQLSMQRTIKQHMTRPSDSAVKKASTGSMHKAQYTCIVKYVALGMS